jgi:hypothetical protein
MVKKPGSK